MATMAQVTLKGGPATFFGIGGANGIYLGLHGGMAATVPIEQGCHLRVDLSRRVYFEPGESLVRSLELRHRPGRRSSTLNIPIQRSPPFARIPTVGFAVESHHITGGNSSCALRGLRHWCWLR